VLEVKYWHTMGYVMSCSYSEEVSLHLIDLNVQSRRSSLKIEKGVISFDFCQEWNIIGMIMSCEFIFVLHFGKWRWGYLCVDSQVDSLFMSAAYLVVMHLKHYHTW